MLIRKTSIALSLLVALAAAGAHAEPAVVTLAAVQGTVLVSKADGLAAGAAGQPLAPGARVVVTNQSRAVVKSGSGCEVVVPENSRVTVPADASCAALKTAVIALPAAGAIGGAAGAAGGAASVPLFSTGGVAALAGAGGLGYGGYKTLVLDRNSSRTSGQ